MILKRIDSKILTHDVRSYVFVAEEPLHFIAGQFVQLKQPGAEQKLARAFSMASKPNQTEVTFLMKHNPEGHVSGYAALPQEHISLESSAPLGRFTLDPNDSDRIFVATGTGLAPIISFIETIEAEKISIPFTTIFGVRHESDLFWTEKLPSESLITLSQPSENWSGLQGRVTEFIPALLAEHLHAAWYICGNPEMVKSVRELLLAAQIKPAAIHFEIY
ncbi:MAG: FAD-binding oxidoreductase [Candidatus Magasanikbacteria bacterium]|nr:FAD-binding oxidoreductase [Candidatus Magasanikbacteria bacterium]